MLTEKSQRFLIAIFFSDMSLHIRNRKNKQMELYETEKFLNIKGNHQQHEKTTHRMGEHIQQVCI